MTAARRLISLAFLTIFAMRAMAAAVPLLTEIPRVPIDEDEEDLWRLALQHENALVESGKAFRNPDVEAYLKGVSTRLAGDAVALVGIDLGVLLVGDTSPRAWVYPYGTVVVHSGLLASLDNEAQLAAVLAHELAHFLRRHAYAELVAEKLPSMLARHEDRLGTIIIEPDDDDPDADTAGRFWTDLAINGYTRPLEMAADQHALRLMADAGYETNQAAVAWEQVDRNIMTVRPDITLIWSVHHRPLDRIRSINAYTAASYFVPHEVPGPLPYYEGVAAALIRNAALELRSHFYNRARMQISMYLGANPDDPLADFLIGESWRLEQPVGPDYTRRIDAYERALAKNSEFAPAWKELGMYYRFHGQADLARKAFNQYLKYGGDSPDSGIIRGYLNTLGETSAQR